MLDILSKLNKIIVFLLFIIQIQLNLSYAQSSKIQKQNITQTKGELFQKNILYVIPEKDNYNGLSNINKSFCIPINKGIQGSTFDNVSTYEKESIAWHTHEFYGISNWNSFYPMINSDNLFDSNFINPLKLNEQIQEIQGFMPNINKRGHLNIKLKTNKNINISLNGDVKSFNPNAFQEYDVRNKIPYIYYAIENSHRPVQKQMFINYINESTSYSNFDKYTLLEDAQDIFINARPMPYTPYDYWPDKILIPSITFKTSKNTHIICKK